MVTCHFCGGVGEDRSSFSLNLRGGGETVILRMQLENEHGQPVPVCKARLDSLLLLHSKELVQDLKAKNDPDLN